MQCQGSAVSLFVKTLKGAPGLRLCRGDKQALKKGNVYVSPWCEEILHRGEEGKAGL